MNTRRVCFFTGSRADYGPLLAVIEACRDDPEIDLQVLATGGHLVDSQGLTVRQIEQHGFPVAETIEMVLASDTATGVAKSFGLGVLGYADALARIDPDLLVVLGDRYEALAVAITAALRLLPIAHIGGGEVTVGSTDDSVRHAITKLAHLHFTATEAFRQRVIQLGEDPERVHNTGAPGLDTIRTLPLWNREKLAASLGIALHTPIFAVTYHPATADPGGSVQGASGLLKALERFPEATVIFTGTNVDHGGSDIAGLIHRYVHDHHGRCAILPSLGQAGYLGLVKHADVVIGNSSSGIAEAPAVGTPTVNIGTRQDGRPRASSVIDCGASAFEIEAAIRQAMTPRHRTITDMTGSPYGDGHAAERIVDVLRTVDLEGLTTKMFFDLGDR